MLILVETSDDLFALKLTSMAAIVPFISVAMTFGCILLFGCATYGDSEICYQGFTGLDNGGSCTFEKGHFCDWTSTGVTTKWEVNKNREAFANMYGTNEGARATLTSPWMCEDNFTTICVQFRFMFNDPDGGRLTLKLCHDTGTCEDLWFVNSADKKKWPWSHVSKTITLAQGNRFQIQFEGEKIEDSSFRETNFYLDNIVYKNFSCTQTTTLIISSSTRNPLTSETVTTETYTELSTIQTDMSPNTGSNEDTDEEKSPKLTMIGVLIAVLLLTAAVVVVALYFRRRRTGGDADSKKSSITGDERRSIIMVTNDLYSVSGGYQHTEDGFPLQDVDTPQNHDTLYAVVHKPNRGRQVNPRTDPDVLMQTECDRPVQRQIYDNVAADKGNVPPPPTLGTPSQSCSDEPQDGDVYYSYCH